MVWVKADLDEDANERVEEIQELYDLNKPNAVGLLVDRGIEWSWGNNE